MIIDKRTLTTLAYAYNPLYETKAQSRFFCRGQKASVFLSHKHNEHKLVKEIKAILEGLNSQVYVDWLDNSMPNTTSGETASRIKDKIKTYDKFILIASQAAIDSKWCNWELGFADSIKFAAGNMAIFPIADEGQNWHGNEYLQLYSRIEYVGTNQYINDIYRLAGFYVVSPNQVYYSLSEWLNK